MIRIFIALAIALAVTVAAPGQEAEREPFEAWASEFEARLLDRGVDEAIADSMMDGLEPDPRIIERDSSQPEFVRPLWDYLAGAASDARVDNGLAAQQEHAAALAVVTDAYDVDPAILTAIWGLESAYGAIQGDFDVVRSLATLAWEGRRRGFAEAQLFAVAEMIARGHAARDDLKGSWAGAMGQTQFIPTTYLERAVDMTGDGRIDIWEDEADALGSAANLLTEAGWDGGAPVAFEVALPDDFDYAAWSPARRRAASAWALDGVDLAEGEWAADDLYRSGRILIPAGAQGPAFMVFSNFDALLRYNNSTAYALGVTYLAKRLSGEADLPDGWPEDDIPLTRTQARELQEGLAELGYDPGGVDGMIGPNTRAALREFQRANAITPDGYAGMRMYEAVLAARDG